MIKLHTFIRDMQTVLYITCLKDPFLHNNGVELTREIETFHGLNWTKLSSGDGRFNGLLRDNKNIAKDITQPLVLSF